MSKRCVGVPMSVKRNRPKGARIAAFGLGLCGFALLPNEIGYQDIASLLVRQPGVAERWQQRNLHSTLGSVQLATFSFGRPIGTFQAIAHMPIIVRMIEIGLAIPAPLPESPTIVGMKNAAAKTGPMNPIDCAITSRRLRLPLPSFSPPEAWAPICLPLWSPRDAGHSGCSLPNGPFPSPAVLDTVSKHAGRDAP
mgnify:CR=1 FL=1